MCADLRSPRLPRHGTTTLLPGWPAPFPRSRLVYSSAETRMGISVPVPESPPNAVRFFDRDLIFRQACHVGQARLLDSVVVSHLALPLLLLLSPPFSGRSGQGYTPPLQAVSRLLTDQAFHQNASDRCHAAALRQRRSEHQEASGPLSPVARQTLYNLCRDDSDKGLRELRAVQHPSMPASVRVPVISRRFLPLTSSSADSTSPAPPEPRPRCLDQRRDPFCG